jgi:eukaryotic-like serine/threonine-protein kinase
MHPHRLLVSLRCSPQYSGSEPRRVARRRGSPRNCLRTRGVSLIQESTGGSTSQTIPRSRWRDTFGKPRDDRDLVGRSLAHFLVLEKVGAGGMGVVYKAIDTKLRRTVALKVLPDSLARSEDRRRRFLLEARSAAAITHSNVPAIYDAGEADGHFFIAMELVLGETLRVRMEQGISVHESARIVQGIARGVIRAHEKGIIHRDLKPENIMLTRDDEVKILDFGLAKLFEPSLPPQGPASESGILANLTGEGHILGSPAYMAPEQARGQDVDRRTDVFALGVLFFEMATGNRPFGGLTRQDVVASVLRDTPALASALNPSVSPSIARVIERCLEKLPEARYATARELLDAISTALSE